MISLSRFLFSFFLGSSLVFAHGDHREPDVLPPYGPHLGEYAKMQIHYFEIVPSKGAFKLYILEPDLLDVAKDAKLLSVSIRSRMGKYQRLRFKQTGKEYSGRYKVPGGSGLVYIQVEAEIDGKRERGTIKLPREDL